MALIDDLKNIYHNDLSTYIKIPHTIDKINTVFLLNLNYLL